MRRYCQLPLHYKKMKQIKSIGVFFLILNVHAAVAQFTADYMPLKSSGTIPEEFVKTVRTMSEEEVKTIGYGADRSAKMQFIYSSNYFLRDLLLSGDILINDPLTKYVNKVADELLKNEPDLRKKIQIYVTKSSDVNAHAFDKGFIFINVGLLAQLENEAQLAFILSHEISHIVKKHSVNQFIENIKLDKGTSSYETGSYEARNMAKYRFSKENESEADIEGLARIKNTKYGIKTLNGAFDVMQYSYLPFELIEFKKSFFEDEYLVLPDTVFLKKTSEIKSNDDYDDTKSTHPNIRKRRAAIEADLVVEDEATRKKYLVSEDEFKKSREIARFESCRLFLIERDYINAIYAAYILLQKYPDNVYLKKTVAKSLYNIAISKSSTKRYDSKHIYSVDNNQTLSSNRYYITDYEKIEGASQRLYYMLDNLDAKELTTIALSYSYKAHKKHPNDAFLSMITDSLFSEMVNVNSLYVSDFSTTTKADLKNLGTVKKNIIDTTEEETKYSQIKKQQEKVEIETDENYIKYAFVGLLKDKEFVAKYTEAANGLAHKKAEKEDVINYKEKRKREAEIAKKNKSKHTFLGIDKVVFLDPFYMKVNKQNGKAGINYFESEEKQAKLAELQKKCANKLNLSYEIVSAKKMTIADIDRYNQNSTINDWLTERFQHGDNNDELVFGTEEMKSLIQKYGTKYIVWQGIYNEKKKHTTYFCILFNLESGELMKYETRYVRSKDSADLINSFVYNSLMHIVKKAH